MLNEMIKNFHYVIFGAVYQVLFILYIWMLFTFQWYCLIVPPPFSRILFSSCRYCFARRQISKREYKKYANKCSVQRLQQFTICTDISGKVSTTNIFFIHSKKCTPGTTCMQICWLYHWHQLIFKFMRI